MPEANAERRQVSERNNLAPPHIPHLRPRHLVFRIRVFTISHSASAPPPMMDYPFTTYCPFPRSVAAVPATVVPLPRGYLTR